MSKTTQGTGEKQDGRAAIDRFVKHATEHGMDHAKARQIGREQAERIHHKGGMRDHSNTKHG